MNAKFIFCFVLLLNTIDFCLFMNTNNLIFIFFNFLLVMSICNAFFHDYIDYDERCIINAQYINISTYINSYFQFRFA